MTSPLACIADNVEQNFFYKNGHINKGTDIARITGLI